MRRWVRVAPTRIFPLGGWFHAFTTVFLLLAAIAILIGALLTVAWEPVTVYRLQFNATDDYWLRRFKPWKDERRCEKALLEPGNSYYTTNGIFKWTITQISYPIEDGTTPYDAGLTGYSGQRLRDLTSPIGTIEIAYYPLTMEIEFSTLTWYNTPNDLGLMFRGKVLGSDFGRTTFDSNRLDLWAMGEDLKNLVEYRTPLILQTLGHRYNLTSDPTLIKIRAMPRNMTDHVCGDGDENCNGDNIYFEHLITLYWPDLTTLTYTPTGRELPQWDLGLGYIIYSAAVYDLGHEWPYGYFSNETMAMMHTGGTLNEVSHPLVDAIPPDTTWRTQYRCVFKVLKSPPNAVFSVLTTFLSLMAGIWAGYKLIAESWASRWHGGELRHVFELPHPGDAVQRSDKDNGYFPGTASSAAMKGDYVQTSSVER